MPLILENFVKIPQVIHSNRSENIKMGQQTQVEKAKFYIPNGIYAPPMAYSPGSDSEKKEVAEKLCMFKLRRCGRLS